MPQSKKQLLGKLAVTLTLTMSFPSFAFSAAGELDKSCAMSTDKNEMATKFTAESNNYAGQCLDTDRFRPAVIIPSGGDSLVFDNYFHNDQYWQASFSKTAQVDSIYVQVVRFSIVSGVTAAHVQLRAKFSNSDAVTLTSSKGDEVKVNDVVISFEAARPKDTSYNFALGVANNYALVGRVASGEQRAKEYGADYTTEQYKINLSQQEMQTLIVGAIQKSAERGTSEFYNTLKPNCTTEIFDLIDQLDSLKDKVGREFQPFLTEISPDPVAGPTVQAIKDRGIFEGRYADLDKELAGDNSRPDEIETPSVPFLFPQVEDYPYSIVQASTGGATADGAKASLLKMVPKLIHKVAATQMLSGSQSSFALMASIKEMGSELKEQLQQLEKDLGNETLTVSLYVTPWDSNEGEEVDAFRDLGVPARLPFKTYETFYDNAAMQVHFSLNDANGVHAANKVPFGLLGVTMKIQLKKGESRFVMQIAGHTGKLEKELIVDNDLVKISSVIIPDGGVTAPHLHPMALIKVEQKINEEVPSLMVEFGNIGGLVFEPTSEDLGEIFMNDSEYAANPDSCQDRANSAPALVGTAKQAKNLVDAWLQIFSVEFDVATQSAKNIEVRTTTGIANVKTGIVKGCERDEEVNKLFTDSVNAQLNDQKEKLGNDPGLALISELLSNNKEGKVSGFEN